MLLASSEQSLGAAYDQSVFGAEDGDLMFEFGGPSGFLIQAPVVYITSPDLPGDYNGDGTVNAADYTVYRNRLSGIGGTTLPNDAGDPGVTIDDYDYWKAHYGETAGSGASLASADNVPEPATLALCLLTIAGAGLSPCYRRRRQVPRHHTSATASSAPLAGSGTASGVTLPTPAP
jgi:hypothetical protein